MPDVTVFAMSSVTVVSRFPAGPSAALAPAARLASSLCRLAVSPGVASGDGAFLVGRAVMVLATSANFSPVILAASFCAFLRSILSVGFFAALTRTPSVAFEKIGDAGHGVGVVEHVNLSVIVAIFAVGQNVGGHKLGNTHRTGKGAGN